MDELLKQQEVAMGDLITKLKKTEEELQSTNKCENNHMLRALELLITM